MGMALALEYLQVFLREKNGWKPNQCGVQWDAVPPNDAGQFYVAIDDAGIESGNEDTDNLREILNITIGIWHRPEHLPKDRRGILKFETDKYLLTSVTLAELERRVKIHKGNGNTVFNNRNGLHGNYVFMNEMNTYWNLPHEEYGASFITPLKFRGKGRMESLSLDNATGTDDWFGYRLRFRGCERNQRLRLTTDAIG